MNKRFATLLQREWMQHGRGWMILLALPWVVIMGLGLFAGFRIEMDGERPTATVGTLMLTIALTMMTLGLACGAALLMAPGLARRDVQDRSIEFWVSLPSSHVQSLAATLLMHLVALPVAGIVVGVIGGLLATPLLAAQHWGLGAWAGLPWGQLMLAFIGMALRLSFGIVLAVLWLSPLILGTMAASAWLKRWGVPAVVGGLVAGHALLEKFYNVTAVGDAVRTLLEQAVRAVVATADKGRELNSVNEIEAFVPALPAWLLQDAAMAVSALATPAFLAALAGGALMFGLLVLRRQRAT
jgi:ABC-2 type transport system permease protein